MGVDPGWPAWIVRTSEDTPYRALLTSRAGRVTLTHEVDVRGRAAASTAVCV